MYFGKSLAPSLVDTIYPAVGEDFDGPFIINSTCIY